MDEALRVAETRNVRWVSGHFDPLLLEHVRRLRGFEAPGYALIALVTNSAAPLLSQRARAELVAALDTVNFVVIKDGFGAAEEPEDAEITSRFVKLVLERHQGEQP